MGEQGEHVEDRRWYHPSSFHHVVAVSRNKVHATVNMKCTETVYIYHIDACTYQDVTVMYTNDGFECIILSGLIVQQRSL